MKNRLNFSPEPFRQGPGYLGGLWILNLALLLLLGWSFIHWFGLREQNASAHSALDHLKQKQQAVADQHGDAVTELENVDMKQYRKTIQQFHNIQTAFQTHWGRLLDDLAAVLPEDVRVLTLRPAYTSRSQQEKNNILHLTAEARNKEAQLALIEALSERDDFSDVRFEAENYDQTEVALVFEITFAYRPGS